MNLRYRSKAAIEDLELGECTIRLTGSASGPTWWELWFYVLRETDGVPEDFAVPVIPRGSYTESGPGGRSWGLGFVGDGVWQVSPSINVVEDLHNGCKPSTHPGPHPDANQRSIWHQTPTIVDVPTGEPWQT